jgi:membrane associated rhomboid family serine protease
MTDDAPIPVPERPYREPLFNAPWTAVALSGLLIVCFLGQGLLSDAQFYDWTLRPAAVLAGNPTGLFTSLFLHGGWPHVLMNAAFCLAFGAPVARLLGTDARGAGLTALFYITCGVLAGLGYIAVHPGSDGPVVGASGAVAGLMGAASRLIQYRGVLGPIRSRAVGSMAAAWVVVNLLVGIFGFPGAGEAGIAWEAHLAGFAVGLFLIGPVARLAGARG